MSELVEIPKSDVKHIEAGPLFVPEGAKEVKIVVCKPVDGFMSCRRCGGKSKIYRVCGIGGESGPRFWECVDCGLGELTGYPMDFGELPYVPWEAHIPRYNAYREHVGLPLLEVPVSKWRCDWCEKEIEAMECIIHYDVIPNHGKYCGLCKECTDRLYNRDLPADVWRQWDEATILDGIDVPKEHVGHTIAVIKRYKPEGSTDYFFKCLCRSCKQDIDVNEKFVVRLEKKEG